MEIKDINNINNMMAGRTTGSPSQNGETSKKSSAGAEFIDLINSKNFFSPAGNEIAASSGKQVSFHQNSGDSSSQYPVQDAQKENTAEKASDREEKQDIPAEDKFAEESSSVNEDKKTSPAEDKAESLHEDTTDTASEPAADEDKNTGDDIADAVQLQLPATGDEISPAELSQAGAVTVFNAETGEYSVMQGKQLAQLLSDGNSGMIPFQSLDGKSDITLVAAANLKSSGQQDKAAGILNQGINTGKMPSPEENIEMSGISGLSPVSRIVKKGQDAAAMSQTNTQSAEMPLQTAAEEAVKLSEVIGGNKKARVNVSVTEENFSYATAKEDFSATQVLQSAYETKTEPALKKNTDIVSSAVERSSVQTSEPQTAQQLNLFNFAGQNQIDPAVSGKTETLQNVQSGSGLQQASSGHASLAADLSASVKTEGRAETENKTSFRDVYKGLGKEAVEQIKVNITKSAVKGVDTINVQLKPEELGHIEIKMQIAKDGKLQAHIISSRPETMDMLQKEIPSLEKAFNEAGFETDNGSFSFSFRDDSQAGRQNEGSNLRSFLGDALNREAGNENFAEESASYDVWDGTSALNIRV